MMSSIKQEDITNKIRMLNDLFRTTFEDGIINITAGIEAKSKSEFMYIINQVKHFNHFTPDNDPYKEHDFGSFNCNDDKIFWKIDYYDKQLQYGSEDPSNTDITTRVLTIMTAEEY